MTGTPDAGRYRLTSRIATGGMGEVWRAEDTVLHREVAVKVLKPEYADDPDFRARFEAEARHAAALVHPHVASVFDFGELGDDEADRRPFLVMELVPGQPLSALLRSGEPMPAQRASDLVAQAADAIAAAHAMGIVHRDVKPANLLVTPDGTVKITDFGIARAAGSNALTGTGQIVGTPHYLSPEQAEGHQATPASDVYALGVVLYECLAGRRPFHRDTPIQVALAHLREDVPPLPESVPAHLRAVVERALAKDPAQRFAGAADMAAALRGGSAPASAPAAAPTVAAPAADSTLILDRTPTPPAGPPTTAAGPGDRRRRLPPWWPWAAAAVAVLAIVLTTALLGQGGSARPAVAEEPSDSTSSAPVNQPDDRIRVRAEDYVGRDFQEVKDELEAQGLEVQEEKVPATSPDQAKDTVAALSPTGLVEPGTRITVEVWDTYEDSKTGGDEAKPGKGKEPPGKAKGKDH